jgi:hypothetical protein
LSLTLASVCEVVFLTCFRETYKVAILRSRVKRLGLDRGKGGAVVQGDQGGGLKGLGEAVLRPARVLLGSGVLMAMSAFGSVVFSYYYIMSTTLSEILGGLYGLDPITVGFCFVSFSKFPLLWVLWARKMLIISRHWVDVQRLRLQPAPRQDLH